MSFEQVDKSTHTVLDLQEKILKLENENKSLHAESDNLKADLKIYEENLIATKKENLDISKKLKDKI